MDWVFKFNYLLLFLFFYCMYIIEKIEKCFIDIKIYFETIIIYKGNVISFELWLWYVIFEFNVS